MFYEGIKSELYINKVVSSANVTTVNSLDTSCLHIVTIIMALI